MKNKDVKYMRNDSWDIFGKQMLRKLSEYAKKGWLLDEMELFRFKLVRSAPEDRIYDIDFQPAVTDRDEYLALFKDAGWTLACEYGCFNVFYAAPGTLEIYTDKTYLREVKKKRLVKLGLAWGMSILGFWLSFIMPNGFLEVLLKLMCGAVFGGSSAWLVGLLISKI